MALEIERKFLVTGDAWRAAAHEVVITLWRYLIDDLDEAGVLKLNQEQPLANCSLTCYVADSEGRLHLDLENWTVPLESEAVPVTEAHDVPVGPR